VTTNAWQTSAPCASADPDAWYPEFGEKANDAKAICRSCPYKTPCLLEALQRGERYGVWGGLNLSTLATRRNAWRQVGGHAKNGRPRGAGHPTEIEGAA
jgi:hypothetical protein